MSLKFDDVKKLHQKKYRNELGYFLVEGEHLILELHRAAQLNPALLQSELYVTEAYAAWPSPLNRQLINAKQMAQIADTKTPQGIIALVPISALAQQTTASQSQRAVYLYQIQDPGNLGTILRSLAWFGNMRCLLSADSVDPFNPKVVRASMGAIFHVAIELDVAIEALSTRFQAIACLDMDGKALSHSDFKTCDCFVFGNEARGVPREQLRALNPQAFTIAGCGAIESLNLATAVNICVYELNR